MEVHRFGVSLFLLLLLFGCNNTEKKEVNNTLTQVKEIYQKDLEYSIAELESLRGATDIEQKKKHFVNSRLAFKRIEPILNAIDKHSYSSLNAPNILKVEEEDLTNITIKKPFGYQVIEETLYDSPIDTTVLKPALNNTINRLKFLNANIALKSLKPKNVLWLIRDQIIKVATTGITGFDSPVLANSLEESRETYKTLDKIIDIYKDSFKDPAVYQEWKDVLQTSIANLNGDFDTFDRYTFIKNNTQPQLKLWNKTTKDWGVEYLFSLAINNDATSLFDKNTFNIKYFGNDRPDITPYKVELGKKLFNDKKLSSKLDMSCATCHQKDKAFTDGKIVFPKQTRNTPTLPYTAYQHGFFYDMRAGSLEGQIVSVVNNKDEFHSSLKDMVKNISKEDKYKIYFDSLYNGKITDANIRNAIASYIKDLGKFNSKFDNNINGKEKTMTSSEINGFNLFMGKAACATCHFPPAFNGTVPPFYKESEMEHLGVLAKPNIAKIDPDLGRYYFYETPERKHFFKTPTIRNIALTAPYMHNGAYPELKDVMDFYNHGGGAGLGLELPLQTLPSDSLHLNKQEINDIISFMHTLTDEEH